MAEGGANPSLGGYDDEFVNAVDEELQCVICHLPLKEPVQTKCGHRFCKTCLDEHAKRFALIASSSTLNSRKVDLRKLKKPCRCGCSRKLLRFNRPQS